MSFSSAYAWLRSHWDVICRRALFPLLLIVAGIAVEDQFKDWWLGPKSYKIYLVGSLTDRETARIFRGFEVQHESLEPRLGNVPVEITIIDDRGTPAGAQSASRVVSQSDDALLVIGHVISTDTIAALPTYVGASPPIPVITTRETSPELKCPQQPAECPVLRMSPSDADQARDMVDFAVKKHRPGAKFAIVGGDYNSTYALALAKLLNEEVNRRHLQADMFPSRSAIPANQFINSRYDVILVAAEPDDSKSLVARIKDEFKNNPNNATEPVVVLSDASFDRTLLMDGGSELLEGVSVTYQLGRVDDDQRYHAYGLDAFDLASDLLSETNGRIMDNNTPWTYKVRHAINMHRVADARSILLEAINESLTKHAAFLSQSGDTYKFDSDGHRLNGRFHIWQISHSKFVDIDGPIDNPSVALSVPGTNIQTRKTSDPTSAVENSKATHPRATQLSLLQR
jgi:ABC-type branched-subunit amino acid transport system substrate-binding protein